MMKMGIDRKENTMKKIGWSGILAGVVFLVTGTASVAAQAEPSSKEIALKKLTQEYARLIKASDKDGNGSLNVVEFRTFYPALRERASALRDEADPGRVEKRILKEIKKYDENDDGKLDEAEKKVMAEKRRLKDIEDFDWNRDEKLSDRERKAMGWAREGYLEYKHRRADPDGNGEATTEELVASIQYLSGLKVKAPQ